MRSHRSVLSAVFACLFFLMGSAQVSASTPDGETPANEGVCDTLIGATPGLYGLCVAYCEAQDLDSVNKGKRPNVKILENYNKKKTAGDPDMPCVKVPCPCFDASDLNMASPFCTSYGSSIQIQDTAALSLSSRAADIENNSCTLIELNTSPIQIKGLNTTGAEAQSCYDLISQACP